MSDPDKPNPVDDLRKGLGLLFRAAKTTFEKLPTEQIEEAVLSGAKEVGRALENVTHTEQFLRKPTARAADEPAKTEPTPPPQATDGASGETKAAPGKDAPEDPKTRIG
jgi:hypothetical protein